MGLESKATRVYKGGRLLGTAIPSSCSGVLELQLEDLNVTWGFGDAPSLGLREQRSRELRPGEVGQKGEKTKGQKAVSALGGKTLDQACKPVPGAV